MFQLIKNGSEKRAVQVQQQQKPRNDSTKRKIPPTTIVAAKNGKQKAHPVAVAHFCFANTTFFGVPLYGIVKNRSECN